LDPHAALSAAYASADPATLVRMGASQLLARHLAMRTLRQVLVEDRAGMSRSLGADLQEMLSRLNTGIEVLSVIVEAAHPPGGAAAAYRQVQAAEIAAQTEISLERGRAETTAGLAARDAADVLASATAGAAERVARAQAQRTAMLADEFAHHASPGAFALERRLSALQAALGAGEADILDPRLEPTLDLRQAEQGK
jgi:regulator of protease activity HflC (stomatin/prohibitin superfamily)